MTAWGHSRHPRADIRPMPAFMSTRPKTNLLKSRGSAHTGCRAVRDSTPMAWYPPSTHLAREGYDSHHRTAGVAGRARPRGSRMAARGARAAADAGVGR